MDKKYCAKGRCRLDRVIHVMMIDMLGKDVPSAMFGVIKKGAEKILGTRLHIIMVRVDKTKYFQRTLKNHSKLDSKKKTFYVRVRVSKRYKKQEVVALALV